MKFNYKFFVFKKVYIFFYLLALLNVFFSTENIQAKTFSINDIEISTPFEINFDKNEIIDKGFMQGFDQLILSIAQTQDQNKFKNIPIGVIKGMIETFSIKNEKFIDEIYYLSLNVSFNKKKIFNLLESKNIFPSVPIKKKIFILPIILDENKNEILMFSESYLFNNWNSKISKHHLLEYVLPSEDLEDFNSIKRNSKNLENFDFKDITQKYNLNDYIITIIFKNNNQIRVLNKINFNNQKVLKNIKFSDLQLNNKDEIDKFIENLKNLYENYWKSKNEINTSVKLSLTVSIKNDDNSKVTEFEKNLDNIDLVNDFYIFKFNSKNNIYKITFNGSPDQFLRIMSKQNYEFNTENQIWILR